MKIARLDLLAYGPFRGLELDLSAPGLHLVFGPNEAGKSTTLRAIRGLLYGIDRKTRDDHVHAKELRVGGTLVSAKGERIRVVRRRGNANTLLDERNNPLDEDVVLRFLRGVTKETFEHAFALDHETLRRGAEGLLEGKGDLGESLFDASVGGGGSVQALLAELEGEADRLYKPRGSTLPLNEALKSFAEASRAVRERQSLPNAYLSQEKALEEAKEEHAERVRHRSELQRKRTILERARRRAPLEARLLKLRDEHAGFGALADKATVLASLDERIRAYDAADATRREATAEAERQAVRVAELARHAGVTSMEEAPKLDARKKGRATALVLERSVHEAAVVRARAEIARHERELTRLGAHAVETSELARVLEVGRALGDAETRSERDAMALARRRKELETRAAQLAIFEGPLAERVALRVPTAFAVEHLASRAADVDKVLSRLDDRLAKNAEERAQVARLVAEATGDFAPPSAADLAAVRATRDEAIAEGSKTVAKLVRDADDIADRMIREADRVTSLARQRQTAIHLERTRTELEEERAKAAAARALLDEEHQKLFAPLVPRSFGEMRRWLERHSAIASEHTDLVAAEEDLAARIAEVEAARLRIRTVLGRDGRLAEIVAEAGRLVADAEQARRERAKLESAIEERRIEHDEHERRLTGVRERLAEILGPLGLPSDATGDEIASALQALGDLFAAVDARTASEARARSADADARSFEADVARLVADLAPDLANLPFRDAGLILVERGRKAEQTAGDITKTTTELEELGGDGVPHELDVSDAAMDALVAELEELDGELQRLSGVVGGVQRGFDAMRAESNAADAAADANEALTRVRSFTERWVRAKLGALILEREIARYRDENQGPLLTSASTLFQRLTIGKFGGVKAGFDDGDRPAIVCVRSNGSEVGVEGLSEGTRDQLYMSLRLASLLRYAGAREALPLVLDDVLVHSDDERAAAALGVLAEVAGSMQVLLFTHHARVVELARKVVPDLHVHDLTAPPLPIQASLPL